MGYICKKHNVAILDDSLCSKCKEENDAEEFKTNTEQFKRDVVSCLPWLNALASNGVVKKGTRTMIKTLVARLTDEAGL